MAGALGARAAQPGQAHGLSYSLIQGSRPSPEPGLRAASWVSTLSCNALFLSWRACPRLLSLSSDTGLGPTGQLEDGCIHVVALPILSSSCNSV